MGRKKADDSPKRRAGYTDEDLRAAMNDYHNGVDGVKINQATAAKRHNIPKSTFSDYIKGRSKLGTVINKFMLW